MNLFVGYPKNGEAPPVHGDYIYGKFFGKATDFFNPGGVFVFVDEHPDSLSGGFFSIGTDDLPEVNGGASENFDDFLLPRKSFPASYHSRASGISFADGHAETHRWIDDATLQLHLLPTLPVGGGVMAVPPFSPASSPHDFLWLWLRMSYPDG